jgi:hypothetical protein
MDDMTFGLSQLSRLDFEMEMEGRAIEHWPDAMDNSAKGQAEHTARRDSGFIFRAYRIGRFITPASIYLVQRKWGSV